MDEYVKLQKDREIHSICGSENNYRWSLYHGNKTDPVMLRTDTENTGV